MDLPAPATPPQRARAAQVRKAPCSQLDGWQLLADRELPRQDAAGRPLGGYSAVAPDPEGSRVWLLSDAPEPHLLPVLGFERLGETGSPPPRFGRPLPLAAATGGPLARPIDGEAMVLLGADLWIASEGRRSREQPAQLLRFGRWDGRLRETFALPEDWLPALGRGLGANQGPEALTLLPSLLGTPVPRPVLPRLLLAAEYPLRQDPEGQVALLSFEPLPPPLPSRFLPSGSLALPAREAGAPPWGLTDLLALGDPAVLLGLVRAFEPPGRWRIQLVQWPWPTGSKAPLQPLRHWDLLALGLTPENWEGVAEGPALSDGRPTLLLVSDDNFNPLQTSRLARLAPLCSSTP